MSASKLHTILAHVWGTHLLDALDFGVAFPAKDGLSSVLLPNPLRALSLKKGRDCAAARVI